MHIAIVLITQDSDFLLQRRGQGENIGSPGLIGCFGGKVSQNEQSQDAARREVAEETTLDISVTDLKPIATFNIEDSLRGTKYDITVDAYRLEIPPNLVVRAREGDLIQVSHSEVSNIVGQMTPATKKLFENYTQ